MEVFNYAEGKTPDGRNRFVFCYRDSRGVEWHCGATQISDLDIFALVVTLRREKTNPMIILAGNGHSRDLSVAKCIEVIATDGLRRTANLTADYPTGRVFKYNTSVDRNAYLRKSAILSLRARKGTK